MPAPDGLVATGGLSREEIEAEHGYVWDTRGLQRDYEVLGFASPHVAVKRRSDGRVGVLSFQHMPRYYWGFEAA
jgi:hypothetical protein